MCTAGVREGFKGLGRMKFAGLCSFMSWVNGYLASVSCAFSRETYQTL